MRASSRSVIRPASRNDARSIDLLRESLEGSSSTALESSGSTYFDSVVSPVSPQGKTRQNSIKDGRPRKTKMQKIQELLDENRQLKDSACQMKQELTAKELQLKALNARQSQLISGEGTKESQQGKHMEALHALTALTKTQQEILAGHHERYEALSRELEESQLQTRQLKKDLSKKTKEVIMLENEIDSNLLEITGLRKELAQALQKTESAETDLISDRRKIIDLTRELALTKAGQNGASDDVQLIESNINIFYEEIKDKEAKIESQQIELEKQVERIQQLQEDLKRTQDQVTMYEKERDATVTEMETCYEAMKFELEQKSMLLKAAEREKTEVDKETAEALRTLEQRCDQLNMELLDAQDEMSVLRRENDASSFASLKSDAVQLEFDEERERLKSTLASMEAELILLKERHQNMQLEHAEAYQALEEENGNLKIQYEEFRSMLREADVRNQALSEETEMQKVQNETLLEISRDLQLKLREAELSKEQDTTIAEVAAIPEMAEAQDGQSNVVGGGHVQSRGTDSTWSTSHSSIGLDPVPEDWQGSSSDSDVEKGNGDINSSFFSDETVVDPHSSPASSERESLPQEALILASNQSSANSSEQESKTVGPSGPTDQQALLLAAAAGQVQKAQSEKSVNSSWRLRKRGQNRSSSPLPPLSGSNISGSDPLGVDKQIENLERENKEQKELIKKLKSEIVRLNAFYRDAAYISKKKVETLTQENAAYEIKTVVLEKMLEKLGGATESHSRSLEGGDSENVSQVKDTADDGDSVQSGAPRSQEAVTPQRDWSSPPRFLDRIKALEGHVKSLEKEKSYAEAKMKAVESDLESFQRTSKKAALDSLFEIERLKRENAEKERQLEVLRAERLDADANVAADADSFTFTYTEELDREAIGENED